VQGIQGSNDLRARKISMPWKSPSLEKADSMIGVFITALSYGPPSPQGVAGQAFTVDGVTI
jgi:hypothetical protein